MVRSDYIQLRINGKKWQRFLPDSLSLKLEALKRGKRREGFGRSFHPGCVAGAHAPSCENNAQHAALERCCARAVDHPAS